MPSHAEDNTASSIRSLLARWAKNDHEAQVSLTRLVYDDAICRKGQPTDRGEGPSSAIATLLALMTQNDPNAARFLIRILRSESEAGPKPDPSTPGVFTALLQHSADGDRSAQGLIFEAVNDELRSIAKAKLSHERAGHILQPTALVNEAYNKLAPKGSMSFECRAHFFGAVSRAMWQVLAAHARRKSPGAQHDPVAAPEALDLVVTSYQDRGIDMLAMDEALEALDRHAPHQATVYRLRKIVGYETVRIAEIMNVSLRTVQSWYNLACKYLDEQLKD